MVSLSYEKEMSRRWRNVDRRCTLGVDRRWFQNMGRVYFKTELSPEETTNYQNTYGRPKTLFMCVSKPLSTSMLSLRFLYILFLVYVRREGRKSFRVLLELLRFSYCFLFYIYSVYDFCDKLHAWIDPLVRFRVQIGRWISPKYRFAKCQDMNQLNCS